MTEKKIFFNKKNQLTTSLNIFKLRKTEDQDNMKGILIERIETCT